MSETMPAPTLPWANITAKPTAYIISAVNAQPGKFGKKEYILELDYKTQVSIWGSNYLYLYNSFGNQTSDWIGKEITLHKDGQTGYRVVTAV